MGIKCLLLVGLLAFTNHLYGHEGGQDCLHTLFAGINAFQRGQEQIGQFQVALATIEADLMKGIIRCSTFEPARLSLFAASRNYREAYQNFIAAEASCPNDINRNVAVSNKIAVIGYYHRAVELVYDFGELAIRVCPE